MRRILGYHLPQDRSVTYYARDELRAPLARLQLVIEAIAAGDLDPEQPRGAALRSLTRRFDDLFGGGKAAPAEEATAVTSGDEEVSSDSSSSSGDDSSVESEDDEPKVLETGEVVRQQSGNAGGDCWQNPGSLKILF